MADAPSPTLYFDDLELGTTFALGAYRLDEEEIVAFSQTWAPHPSHVDPAWAATGFFGGIVAPVSLSYSACARLVTVELLPRLAFAAGREVVLQPKAPVRPGVAIEVSATVAELEPARRRGHGNVVLACENVDEHGTIVLVVRMQLMLTCRPAQAPSAATGEAL